KSAFIAEALKEYVHNKKLEVLRLELKEGYLATKGTWYIYTVCVAVSFLFGCVWGMTKTLTAL
ncbi:hypothetical protein MCHI_001463, partial [Candidatus Magnetoovum chiemensis]